MDIHSLDSQPLRQDLLSPSTADVDRSVGKGRVSRAQSFHSCVATRERAWNIAIHGDKEPSEPGQASLLRNVLPCSGLDVCFFVLLNRLASPTAPAVPSEEGWSPSPAAVEGWVQTISRWSWGPTLITEAGLTLSLLYIPSRACVSCVFLGDLNTCKPYRGLTSWTWCFWGWATSVTRSTSGLTFSSSMPLPLLSRHLSTSFTLSRFIKIINYSIVKALL